VRANEATFTSLHSFFAWDHQRLDAQLAQLKRLVDHGDIPHALRHFGHYERGMQRHMRIEESVLFQTVASERTGAARVPATAIQADHAEILDLVKRMGAALTADDVAGFRAAYDQLAAVMPVHNRKEDETLYPYLDALVGAAEAERIVKSLRSE
jgi:iron-sulfur cluster repair protein YtfE (RIC family)